MREAKCRPGGGGGVGRDGLKAAAGTAGRGGDIGQRQQCAVVHRLPAVRPPGVGIVAG